MTNTDRPERFKYSNIGSLVLDKDLRVKLHTLHDISKEIIGLTINQVKLLSEFPEMESYARQAMLTRQSVQNEVIVTHLLTLYQFAR